jgi:hypothetical protein
METLTKLGRVTKTLGKHAVKSVIAGVYSRLFFGHRMWGKFLVPKINIAGQHRHSVIYIVLPIDRKSL